MNPILSHLLVGLWPFAAFAGLAGCALVSDAVMRRRKRLAATAEASEAVHPFSVTGIVRQTRREERTRAAGICRHAGAVHLAQEIEAEGW